MSYNFSSFQLSKQNEKRKKNLICLRGLCLPLSLLLLRFPIYLTKGFPSIFGFSMEITKTKTSHFLLLFSFSFALCYYYYNISVQIMLRALTLTFFRKNNCYSHLQLLQSLLVTNNRFRQTAIFPQIKVSIVETVSLTLYLLIHLDV